MGETRRRLETRLKEHRDACERGDDGQVSCSGACVKESRHYNDGLLVVQIDFKLSKHIKLM